MGRLLASLFPTVAKCSLIMLGIREPSLIILLRLLKSFNADMTFKFFFFRRCKSSLIPCQISFHVAHIIFEKRIIISPFA